MSMLPILLFHLTLEIQVLYSLQIVTIKSSTWQRLFYKDFRADLYFPQQTLGFIRVMIILKVESSSRGDAYLPSQTPPGIKDLRREDLLSIQGNGKGERKLHERVYDYAPYNDLGNPDKDADRCRPVLLGSEFPYPRRCRSGRSPMKTNPECESRIEKPKPVYVPRDETFEEMKQATFSAGRLRGVLHNLVPRINATLSSSDLPFGCFSEFDKLHPVQIYPQINRV